MSIKWKREETYVSICAKLLWINYTYYTADVIEYVELMGVEIVEHWK